MKIKENSMSKRYEVRRITSAYSLNWVNNDTNEKLRAVEIEKIVNNQAQRIAELEEQLKNAIRFKIPQIERFAVVQYIHWNKKPYKIVNCFDAYKDENMETRHCFYGVPCTNFKVIQICDTKEEALARLKELQGE